MMKVIPRQNLDKDLLMPYQELNLQDLMQGGSGSLRSRTGLVIWPVHGYIPADAYPLKVIHSDNQGYLILLLDEQDDDSLIIVQSMGFKLADEEVNDG